ncbi:acj6 [Trypoxylus dichotomus]
MMGSKGPTGLHGPITSSGACFPGRYSPTYRSPEPMARRCMPNPSYDGTVVHAASISITALKEPFANHIMETLFG